VNEVKERKEFYSSWQRNNKSVILAFLKSGAEVFYSAAGEAVKGERHAAHRF
jgi:hypothetical protein